MKYYGDLHSGLSEKEKLLEYNRQKNFDGWFDKIFEHLDLRHGEKMALLAGDAIYAENETCVVRCQLTMAGNLSMVVCHKGETKCVTIDRLSGEKKVDFYVEHENLEVNNADELI